MTTSFSVRLLSRLVGRDEAHSSKSDEMRAAFIVHDGDTLPSQSMPGAGFKDWREVAEWWERTCIYWHGECDTARAANAALTEELERALTPGSPGVVQKGERT